MPKAAKTLDELFHDTLKDIFYAEKKILAALPKMAKAAQNPDLLHVLDGLQVSNSGTQMVVNIDEPGDLVKKLRQLRQSRGLRRFRG